MFALFSLGSALIGGAMVGGIVCGIIGEDAGWKRAIARVVGIVSAFLIASYLFTPTADCSMVLTGVLIFAPWALVLLGWLFS